MCSLLMRVVLYPHTVVRICSAIISVLARHPHPTAQATPSGTSSGRGLVVCRLEWNHDDKAEVGVASVATLHVSGVSVACDYHVHNPLMGRRCIMS